MTKKRIGFIANSEHVSAAAACREAMDIAKRKGYGCFMATDAQELRKELPDEVYFLVVVGGDGTILKTVPYAIAKQIPILGINTGRVGFLSAILPEQFSDALDRIESDGLCYEERMMLDCSLNGRFMYSSLNETLLYRRSDGGTAHVRIAIDGLNAGRVICDGVLACTPTGSTGYSISAGGPIISPGCEAILITPICPHTLATKPIVASSGAKIEFVMDSDGTLCADGKKLAALARGDRVAVRRSPHTAHFVDIGNKNLFQLIKDKLIY